MCAETTGRKKKRPRTPRAAQVNSAVDAESPPASVSESAAGSGGRRRRGRGRYDTADDLFSPPPEGLLQAGCVERRGARELGDEDETCDDMAHMPAALSTPQPPLSATRVKIGGRLCADGADAGDEGPGAGRTGAGKEKEDARAGEEKEGSAGKERRALQQVPIAAFLCHFGPNLCNAFRSAGCNIALLNFLRYRLNCTREQTEVELEQVLRGLEVRVPPATTGLCCVRQED